MRFSTWLLAENDFVFTREIPAEPGTSPIPPDHVRLYHYTGVEQPGDAGKFQAAELIRQNGLDVKKAKGSSYGEPNVVWASTAMPGQFKVFAEFSIHVNDPRWAMGKPQPGESPRRYEAKRSDCYFRESIRPDEIIAVHEPWHWKYRYLQGNPRLWDELANGNLDQLMNDEEYGPAVRRAKQDLTTWRANAGSYNQTNSNPGRT